MIVVSDEFFQHGIMQSIEYGCLTGLLQKSRVGHFTVINPIAEMSVMLVLVLQIVVVKFTHQTMIITYLIQKAELFASDKLIKVT